MKSVHFPVPRSPAFSVASNSQLDRRKAMISRLTTLLGSSLLLLASAATGSATDYDIDFKVTNTNSYDVLQFKVNYTSAPGEFAGSGGSVSCTANSSLNSLA